MSGVHIEISANKISVPHECACCGAEPTVHRVASFTKQTGKKVVREQTHSLNFPYCATCDEHITLYEAAGNAAGTTMFVAIALAIVLAIAGAPFVGVIVFICALPIALVMSSNRRSQARLKCTRGCVGPESPVEYLARAGTVSGFSFQSKLYAVKFAEGNTRNLVNISMELRQLLAASAAAPQGGRAPNAIAMSVPVVSAGGPAAVPVNTHNLMPYHSPPMAVGSSPMLSANRQGDLVLEWIARIESFKGSEARRNALRRGLAEVTDLQAQRDLRIAACRIEVAAVLDKVDELASPAAKRRHLENALAELVRDDIPDELQASELHQLRSRLAQLS